MQSNFVIEVDGGIHKLEDQQAYDLKFTNEQVEEDVDAVLDEIESYLP